MFTERTIENCCCDETDFYLLVSYAAPTQTFLRVPILAQELLVFITPLAFSFRFKEVLFSKLISVYTTLHISI